MSFAWQRIALTLLLIGLWTSGSCGEEPWKLQPLKYNHPGLVVDLGVGCGPGRCRWTTTATATWTCWSPAPTSRPTASTTSRIRRRIPRVKMPVFKPGVRIGPTGHNIQVSYVDGKPRILKKHRELTGVPHRVISTTQDEDLSRRPASIAGRTRANMWRYVDYDGDGDHDLIVGVGDWTDYGWDHAYDNHGAGETARCTATSI